MDDDKGNSSKFVIRDLPGKGKGVLAVRDISEGELVIAEAPLILIPWHVRHSIYPA